MSGTNARRRGGYYNTVLAGLGGGRSEDIERPKDARLPPGHAETGRLHCHSPFPMMPRTLLRLFRV